MIRRIIQNEVIKSRKGKVNRIQHEVLDMRFGSTIEDMWKSKKKWNPAAALKF